MRSTASEYAIRTATTDDLRDTLRLVSGRLDLQARGVAERERLTLNRMLATPDLTVYVAESVHEIVGTASALVMPNLGYDCHPTVFIEALVVREDHRRRGVARLLLERLHSDARRESCRKVQLRSHKRHADDGAFDFYRAVGFDSEAEGFRLYLSGSDRHHELDAPPPKSRR